MMCVHRHRFNSFMTKNVANTHLVVGRASPRIAAHTLCDGYDRQPHDQIVSHKLRSWIASASRHWLHSLHKFYREALLLETKCTNMEHRLVIFVAVEDN